MLMSSSDFFGHGVNEAQKADDLAFLYHEFGSDKHHTFAGYQVHGDTIADLNSDLPSQFEEDPYFGYEFEKTDGLITSDKNINLVTKFADCTPVVIYDPTKKLLSSLHSGWRGTAQKIAPKGIDDLVQKYGADPKDLIVFVGPAISAEDFEVGEDLVQIFEKNHPEIGQYLTPKNNGKFQFDMQKLLFKDLIDQGILEENIYYSDLNTYQNPLLHSYRRDGQNSGRMVLMAKMV